ncbi:hypothetical protein IT402_02035, partial [Candidatus Nomurabacteria bacterium]|nr:hypothetical protein [Candidatus Nomurabacteria bacterium]
TPCDVDARYIFYRNLRADYERGPNTSCISSGTGTYTFNPSTKVLQFSGSGQPARNLIYHDGFRFRVEYVYNGSPRVEIYELVP